MRVSRKIAGILFSEYEPLNKFCYYSLLDTYQLIQGQGTRGAKVPPLWNQQKTKPCIDTWDWEKPFWFANWPWQIFLSWTWNWYKLRETCKWNTKFRSEIPTGKPAHLFRLSTFFGNFPVGRTDETCSIYRRSGEIPEILTKWKAHTVTDWGIEMLFSTI